MRETPYPLNPAQVAALTVPEFPCELDAGGTASLDAVCRRFPQDANRALVWLIRFRALTAWYELAVMSAWLQAEPSHARRACELAASHELNDDWEFDAERFRSAIESVAR